MTIEELLAIEEIKQLRAAYSAHLDHQDLDRLMELFTEDAVCAYPEQYGGDWVGRQTIRDNFAGIMPVIGDQFDAIHVVTNPYIQLTGPDTATGRWYLLDLLTRQQGDGPGQMSTPGGHENPLLNLSIYEDEYARVDGHWRFTRIALHTLWPQRLYTALEHK